MLLHAITDALLGAIAAPDIGVLFPPSDPKWKGADSAVFLREALDRMARSGYRVSNIDSSLILAAPKIGPHSADIRGRVAKLLGIDCSCVGLKAKTPEGLNLENAAVAHVVVLLEQTSLSTKIPASPKVREKGAPGMVTMPGRSKTKRRDESLGLVSIQGFVEQLRRMDEAMFGETEPLRIFLQNNPVDVESLGPYLNWDRAALHSQSD